MLGFNVGGNTQHFKITIYKEDFKNNKQHVDAAALLCIIIAPQSIYIRSSSL